MKINKAGMNFNAFKFGFKSIRTDRKIVEQLKNGDKPILENNKQNIYAALNNLSSNPDRQSIEFLIDVAKNLAYGQGGEGSEFKSFLDEEGLTPKNRENTDWTRILDDTIRKAIAATSENVDDLVTRYNQSFNETKPLTSDQEEIIKLRDSFTSLIVGEESLADAETLSRTARIRKNLDYFIASSEIPISQKLDCIKKFLLFMSDEYKITPQLKDKKLQVIDEMLNDLIIKTPQDDVLTIKSVDQRQSGICAAISICRKAMAYEDKSRYVDLIMEELKDSPVMSVFDVTELTSGKKVNIPKTNVDYDIALSKGYRIIDASAHNWMHNAHASGDGTIQTEYYLPFDDETYGIFNDSSWYLGIDPKYSAEKSLLMAVIKEKELLKAYDRSRKEMVDTYSNLSLIKKEYYETQRLVNGKMNGLFSEIFPEKSDKEISDLIRLLKDFYSGKTEENGLNVPSKLPLEEKQKIVADFIISSVPDLADEQKIKIRQNSLVLYSMLDEYNNSELELKKLKRFNSPRSKYLLNKKLYNVAAAHRIAIETAVNMPDGIVRFESLFGLLPRDIEISNYLKSLKPSLSSMNVRQRWKDKNGNIPDQNALEADLVSDLIKIESVIPKEIDSITKKLLGKTVPEILLSLFENISQLIKEGDVQTLDNVKDTMGLKGDKQEILQKLNKWVEKLSSSPAERDILEGIRLLGYEDRMNFVSVCMSNYMISLKQGISEEQYKRLANVFGSVDKIPFGIESQAQKFANLINEYNAIIEKWQIPSTRVQILKQLEKKHFVVSRQKLEILKNHFADIEKKMLLNEKITDPKIRQRENNKLYQFTNGELEIFDSIKKSIPKMKKYCEMEYNSLNDMLYYVLEDQYANIGMLNGQFWVREEGSSGLTVNEQIRIIEQMTGKPYYMETDIVEAAKKIRNGKGSGIQSLSVDDSDYAFHAQYVPSITSEIFVDPSTGEKTKKDIMWTDNSWGRAEKEHFWNGRNGFLYTDYGNDYGWKDGFILADDYKIGLPVQDIYGSVGYAKGDGEKFGLFTDVVLPGVPINLYQNLYKMFDYILNIKEGQESYEHLEKLIASGSSFNIEELEGLDSIAELKTENLMKRVIKEIKSEADFDNLSDDNELKFLFNKLAVYMSTDNPIFADSVLSVDNNEDLESVKDEILRDHMDIFAAIIGKSDETLENIYSYSLDSFNLLFDEINKTYGINYTEPERTAILSGIFFDEDSLTKCDGSLQGLGKYFDRQIVKIAEKNINDYEARQYFINKSQQIISQSIDEKIRIKSLDNISIVNSPLKDEFIAAVDKYLNPSSDNELLAIIQGLQMADYDTVEKFFDVLEPEDLGIKTRKPYDYVRLLQSGDFAVNKAFSEVVSAQEIYSNLNTSAGGAESTPEELYRSLYVKLAEMDVQKYIKAFKAEAFQKYKVRQAFPEPIVLPDESISEIVDGMYSSIREHIGNIENSKYIYEILSKYEEIKDKFLSQPLFSSLLNREDIILDENNTDTINSFYEGVIQLYELSKLESSFEILNKPFIELISMLKSSRDKIDAKSVAPVIKNIMTIFSDFEQTGVTVEKFFQLKNEEISALKYNIQLMVNANVEPKYRDEALRKIYNLIDMYRKQADEESIACEEEEIKDLVIRKHIVKNPTVLLKECVKLLQAGGQNSNEYNILRVYLEKTLQVAQQTKIQYKLVQNQHEAISSKTKDMLSLFKVKTKDCKSENMNSELGMLYLIEQLKNTGDNYTILNLFLEQSGLSKKALKALINNFEIQKTNKLVKEKTKEIKLDIVSLNELVSLISSYSKINKISPKSLPDSVNQFRTYIKRKLKGLENISVFDKFIQYFDSLQYIDSLKDSSCFMIQSLTDQIIEDAIQYITDGINAEIKYISELSLLVKESAELLGSIRVPLDSDEYQERVEFFKKYEQSQSYISKQMEEIQETLNSFEFLGVQNRS